MMALLARLLTKLKRPTETVQQWAGVVLGAALVIMGAAKDGFDFNDLSDHEVQGAITALVSTFAPLTTAIVAWSQRRRMAASAEDGKVIPLQ